MNEILNTNEQKAASAFSKQAKAFDKLYSGNTIIRYKRKRVRDHISQYLLPNSHILELNCGTGDDAIWFAENGHHVHATDLSNGMIEILKQKISEQKLEERISYEKCSFTTLNQLRNKGPYDVIFSNFAGLNCTGELNKVLQCFYPLLKPGGIITLVILPRFCLWEFLFLFRGKFKTAFRRFFSSKGKNANIEGESFRCWYYNPSYVIRQLANEFDLSGLEGLCTLVPPSYIENFAEKHPALYRRLVLQEEKWKKKWPWKYIGDYYIISFRKKD